MSDIVNPTAALTTGRYDDIDLAQLPFPDAIESIAFERVRAEMIEALGAPYNTAPLSDPVIKVIEVAAAREVKLRARVNDAVKAITLAYSRGSDLEHLGALYGVARRVIQEADSSTFPATPEVLEGDDELRARIQLAPEGFSVAGPQGAYVYHGISAAGLIKSIYAAGPEDHGEPGVCKVYVLTDENGTEARQETLDLVLAALNSEETRPLTDYVQVFAGEIIRYQIKAKIWTYPGPDAALVIAQSQTKAAEYAAARFRLDHDVTDSGIKAALHQAGCQRVEVESPASTLTVGYHQAAYCESIEIEHMGTDV